MLDGKVTPMSLRLSEEEYAELLKRRRGMTSAAATSSVSAGGAATFPIGEGFEKPKRRKYGNRRVEIDGMKFDSQKEANYYFAVLLPSWKAGAYKLLARQVPFDLPGGIRYIADFVTVSRDGEVMVLDTKSEPTRMNRTYINKKKQMWSIWHIEITEV